MKIRKIQTIEEYKSFSDFSWSNFCKDCSNTEQILSSFSLVFGENGSGKSSICEILKNLSQHQDFYNLHPNIAEVEIEDSSRQMYKFENGNWLPNKLEKNSFLFFDVDFINANVHTHGDRSNQYGRHAQNSGKIIIDLDEKANQLKNDVQEIKNELDGYEKTNILVLNKSFSEGEGKLFAIYKDKTESELSEQIVNIRKDIEDTDTKLAATQKIYKKISQINHLELIKEISVNLTLSDKGVYEEIFSRQFKEKSQDNADEKIKEHFEKHKSFIEAAKDQIPRDYKNENCPLCMQPLINASKIIEYYRKAFDRAYENQKMKYISDIGKLKDELSKLKSDLGDLPEKINGLFNLLEKIKTDFEVNIYIMEEKTELVRLNDVSLLEIEQLSLSLDKLKSIDREIFDCTKTYDTIISIIENAKKKVERVNSLIKEKNKLISAFKAKYPDQGAATNEIQTLESKQKESRDEYNFLNSGKIVDIKNQIVIRAKRIQLEEALKNAQDELRKYLANTIPESVITKMIDILEKFNLNFTLEHIKPAPNTKDYSFSFKINDRKGNERNFKDGLSEGERQLISIAFFFAINENLPEKSNVVLIFDDPITSLDSPNLKILADIIHETTSEFSQVIIFTHHPLFYKYMAKCESPNPVKFGILKNHETFGGSFVFYDPGFDLTNELKMCNEEIKQNAQAGILKPEETALKYGQLLRLSVEKFIKHELLLWDKEKNFEGGILANLSGSKNKIQKLSDADLESLKNVYKYCNHSNLLHADKENPSALSELTLHIEKFVAIIDKVNS